MNANIKQVVIALESDFSNAHRSGNKPAAAATVSALAGIALALTPHTTELYNIISNVSNMPMNALSNEAQAIVTLISKNL